MNRPHASAEEVKLSSMPGTSCVLYVHTACPKKGGERLPLLIVDPYTPTETVLCDACSRRFSRKVLTWMKTADIVTLNSLETMRVFSATDDKSKVYHAHYGFTPAHLEGCSCYR